MASHREFMYMGLGWEIMDLRQDIEFAHECTDQEYPVESVIERLMSLQRMVGEYADEQLKTGEPGWEIPKDEDGF